MQIKNKIRLLISMRDIAASAHLIQVIKYVKQDARFEVSILAQEPASTLLSSEDVLHKSVGLPATAVLDSEESLALINFAKDELKAGSFDVVLVGLSTPFDGGIDEAILSVAKVPKLLLQDFWGEQNRFFGAGADLALVLDEAAEKRNQLRFNLPSLIIGSARHSMYAGIDFPAMREGSRASMGVSKNQYVIGFFSQALHHLAGYRRTVLAFIKALENLESNILVLVRPHPRETESQRIELVRMFNDAGLKVVFSHERVVDYILPVCDIVCSLFSNCTYDASYQNWFSSKPLSVPISLLFDPEISEYYRERVDFEELPIHKHGLVVPIYDQAHIIPTIKKALTSDFRIQTWQRAKDVLPDPRSSPKKILDIIEDIVCAYPIEKSNHE